MKSNILTNWQTKNFEDCLDKVVYTNKIFKKDFLENGKYPIVSQEVNFINGYWNNKDDVYEVKTPVILFGDHTQVLKYIDFNFVLGADGIKILKPKNFLHPKFLYFYLLNVNLKSLGYARHYRLLKEEKLLFPDSLPEQHRIVKILDDVFEKVSKAKENAEKNLKNARELFESYLESVFEKRGDGWEEKSLGEVLQKTETVNPTLKPEKEFIYVDVSSVSNKTLTIENSNVLKGKNAPSRARKLIKKDDIIFATVRPTLKRIAIITEEYDSQVCSTGYFVLRAKESINKSLIFYFIQSNSFNRNMERLQKGASYPAVTDNEVRNQIIVYPKSLTEQKEIVTKLDDLSEQTKRLEEIYKQKLADLEELKKSVLKKAFAGEL